MLPRSLPRLLILSLLAIPAAFALWRWLPHSPGQPVAASADMLQVALNGDIRGTQPGVDRDANTDSVMMHIVEGLVGYRENGQPAPLLASAVEISGDGLTYTFPLRRTVRFHNGALMTADDVVWAWHRYLDPATRWICLSDFDGSRGARITSVRAADPATVVFQLDRPNPMLLIQMAALQCGASGIVHRDSVDAQGHWLKPIGTGPYQLQEWRRSRYIDLTAFPGYSSPPQPADGYTGRKQALITHLRWLVIRDEASRRTALMKGQVGLMPEVSVTDISQIRKLPNTTLEISPAMSPSVLLMRDDAPLLADHTLRLALAHSLDIAMLARLSTDGTAVANPSVVPAVSPYYSEVQREGYRYDPALARQLLAQSQYRGQPLQLLTNRRYPEMYSQALMIQSMAREVGINVELQVVEWATQLDRYQSGNYQLMSFEFTARTDPFLSYDSILGDRAKSRRKVWSNPEAIALLQEAGRSDDPQQRQQLFDRLHRILLRDAPLVMLYNLADVAAVNRQLSGYRAWPLIRPRLWNVQRADAGLHDPGLHAAEPHTAGAAQTR